MLVGLVLMLGIFIVSIVVAIRVAAHAVTLTTQQRTRFRGVSILMAGAAGIILTNLLVYVVRTAPSILPLLLMFIANFFNSGDHLITIESLPNTVS